MYAPAPPGRQITEERLIPSREVGDLSNMSPNRPRQQEITVAAYLLADDDFSHRNSAPGSHGQSLRGVSQGRKHPVEVNRRASQTGHPAVGRETFTRFE
jgi:hypothetical protein